MRRLVLLALALLPLLLLSACERAPEPATEPPAEKPSAPARKDPLAAWRPAFDPAGAEHTYLLSCIGHPEIEGVAVGFRIRDRLWEETGGRLYVDYRPLAQLGGEKDVLNKLRMGAVQGMLCSSVAAANVSGRLGAVNLPYLLDGYDELERFRADRELFAEYGAEAREQGLLTVDFTGYGRYGWATTRPVRSLEEAGEINFRIAEAPVNTSLYQAWGLKFTVMPWPDVPQALQTGVIDGLDHTPIVCSISRKFDVARHFTRLDYAQGLYLHLVNRAWFEGLPGDLQEAFLKVVAEESAAARAATRLQEVDEIAEARASGVSFHELPAGERERLRKLAAPLYGEWAPKVGPGFLEKLQRQVTAEP